MLKSHELSRELLEQVCHLWMQRLRQAHVSVQIAQTTVKAIDDLVAGLRVRVKVFHQGLLLFLKSVDAKS